ncbi:hypothetical protein [Poritiphilus flavus]|uniref:Uncharacterized protein n=1 Tax=Poritiphilus flavus TaxID=2697053 RepID=A0A6L9ED77_9FLAO|nr:hypothetical protein [Poritiphilus flavus]NAS12685.1 hypothetical protein [Poritiphilus flavus]
MMIVKLLRISFSLALLVAFLSPANAQQWVEFQFDEFQSVEVSTGGLSKQLKFPEKRFVLQINDLNSLRHLGNSLNVYGNMLLIDNWSSTSDGKIRLSLRREDGRDFFNTFPTLTGTIKPLTRYEPGEEESSPESN